MTDEAPKELVADGTRGPFGNGTKQLSAAKPRAGLVGVGKRRHEPADPPSMLARSARLPRDAKIPALAGISRPSGRAARGIYAAGAMFWLSRNTLSGS